MDPEKFDQHLSQISTMWTAVRRAHQGPPDAAGAALQQLVQQYTPAIYRYLLGALRDTDAADEAFQEFALRLVRGDFKKADPTKGRFRAFLKTALYHLVVDQQRRRNKAPLGLDAGAPEPAANPETSAEAEVEFNAGCRAELLRQAWQNLQHLEQQSGQPLFTILRYRTEHPAERSPVMAGKLAAVLGKTVTPDWVRKQLHLARERLAEFLVRDVTASLDNPTREDLAAELMELGLWDYCGKLVMRSADPAGSDR